MQKIQKILESADVPPEKKLEAFCNFCWTTNLRDMALLYNTLCQEFALLSNEQKINIIPLLIKNSFKYNFLLTLGYFLLTKLPEYERIKVDVSPIWWAMAGNGIIITTEEYVWRCLHCQEAFREHNGIHRRPPTLGDVEFMEKSLQMFILTHKPYPWLVN